MVPGCSRSQISYSPPGSSQEAKPLDNSVWAIPALAAPGHWWEPAPVQRSRVFVSHAYDHLTTSRMCSGCPSSSSATVSTSGWTMGAASAELGQLTLAEIEAAGYVLAIASPGYRQAADDPSQYGSRTSL
jgi:hypothetical protein